jgi:hypothetical protein
MGDGRGRKLTREVRAHDLESAHPVVDVLGQGLTRGRPLIGIRCVVVGELDDGVVGKLPGGRAHRGKDHASGGPMCHQTPAAIFDRALREGE